MLLDTEILIRELDKHRVEQIWAAAKAKEELRHLDEQMHLTLAGAWRAAMNVIRSVEAQHK